MKGTSQADRRIADGGSSKGCRSGAPPEQKGRPVAYADLSSILWREREMLELLLFKLEEEQLVLAAGRTRWLAPATGEVEMVPAQIGQNALLRAAEVAVLGTELGLGPSPSLT